MKRFLIVLALLLLPSLASAQCNGVFPNNTVCGNVTGAANTPRATNPSAFLGAAGGTNGQIQYNNSGALGGFTANGAVTINTSTGLVTLTPLFIGLSNTPTADGAGFTFQNSAKTAFNIYGPIVPPGWAYYDVTRSVLDMQPGAAVQNSAAFGAYTFNNNATGATPDEKNVVGFFVVGVNGVDGARTWGINTSCNDSTPNGLATLNNRVCVGYEVDFTANGASTFEGIPLIIQGPGTPASASAIHVSIVPSSTAKWTNGFIVDNGALVSNGLGAIFGAKSVSGANVASVPVQFTTYDSSGVAHGLTISSIPLTTNVGLSVIDNVLANGIVLQMGAAGAPAGILAQGSDTNINLDIFPKGTGSIILNTGVTLTSVSTSAGTGTYSVCASATGALFLKTSAGACL